MRQLCLLLLLALLAVAPPAGAQSTQQQPEIDRQRQLLEQMRQDQSTRDASYTGQPAGRAGSKAQPANATPPEEQQAMPSPGTRQPPWDDPPAGTQTQPTYNPSLGPAPYSDEQIAKQLAINESGECVPECQKICEDEPTPSWVIHNHLESEWKGQAKIRMMLPNPAGQKYIVYNTEGQNYRLVPASRCNHITPTAQQ